VFSPVRTRHTFEEAAEQIADKVRAGELRSGDKLPPERDLAVPTELIRRRSELRRAEVAHVLEARRIVEPGVAVLAASRATEEDFAALGRSVEAMREIVEGGYGPEHEDRFLQLDVQFHLAMARAAGNPTVETLMRTLFRQLEIARDMAMHLPTVPEWTIAIHDRTLEALRGGDEDDVRAVMDEHLGQLERTARSVR
jgi:GntR family transcriptional regulator, transcriptional repressor for pyruvate dehydrogenase complex